MRRARTRIVAAVALVAGAGRAAPTELDRVRRMAHAGGQAHRRRRTATGRVEDGPDFNAQAVRRVLLPLEQRTGFAAAAGDG